MVFLMGGLALASCNQTPKVPVTSYTVEGIVADSTANGKTIYIINYDDNETIDTTVIQNNHFVFTGTVDTALICRIDVNHCTSGNFILEPGKITLNLKDHKNPASGTAMNGLITQIMQAQDSLTQVLMQKHKELRAAFPDEVAFMQQAKAYYEQQLKPQYVNFYKQFSQSHNDDAIGLYLMYTHFFSNLSLEEKGNALQAYGPWLKTTKTARHFIKSVEAEKNTQPGKPFANIKGVDKEGKELSLSNFIGKGNYVLVDMWASWCAPCKGEIPNLAKLHQRYHNKGLTVVGVFTWDEPENLTKVMKEEKISWSQIIDIDETAMDEYGTEGIPFIFLLSPNGTILERGLRGEGMIATVEEYMKGRK